MEAYLFYTRQSEGERRMERLLRELKGRRVNAEMIDADSVRGIRATETYDLMIRPAVVVVRDDGQLVQAWTDPDRLPPADEISYYAHL